jgi:hypothetical protein
MITVWEKMKVTMPAYARIIDAGIDKLQDYSDRTSNSSAYVLSMSE